MKYTEKNHPQINNIVGVTKEQLINRRPNVIMAINHWKSHDDVTIKDYNINYFEVELSLIDKELAKHKP
jgi:hypothetical protein